MIKVENYHDELSDNEERKLEENLIWIFASPRSGSTWLKQLLSRKTTSLNKFRIVAHLAGRLFNLEGEKKNDYVFSLRYKDTWNYYLRKLILNRIYSQIKDTSKKVIIKETARAGFSKVSECVPNSKIIFLLRDGRDIVDSQVDGRTYGYEKGGRYESGPEEPLNKKIRSDYIKRQSKNWVRITNELLETYENHSKDRRYKLNYEALLNNTLPEVQKIYNFLEIKISSKRLKDRVEKLKFEKIPPELKGKGKATRSASPGKWKKNFNEEEKDLMNSIMRKTLVQLNYAID